MPYQHCAFFPSAQLERRLSPSTIKVDIAAITAHHTLINGRSVRQHNLVIRFLREALNLLALPLSLHGTCS